MTSRHVVCAALAASALAGAAAPALAGSLGGPLELAGRGQLLRRRAGRPIRVSGYAGRWRRRAGPDHDQPDVRAISHPQERERAADRHGARLRPHRRHLRDDAGRARRLGHLFRAQGLSGLCGRPRRSRPLRLRPDADQPRPRRRAMSRRCPTFRSPTRERAWQSFRLRRRVSGLLSRLAVSASRRSTSISRSSCRTRS